MVESLVGLFLFSSIMILYLPAFYNQAYQIQLAAIESEQWRVFYELSLIALDPTIINKEEITDLIARNHNKELSVEYFHCHEISCQIAFGNGSDYTVQVEALLE